MANLTDKIKNSKVSGLHLVVGLLVIAVILLFAGAIWNHHENRRLVGYPFIGIGRHVRGQGFRGGENFAVNPSLTGKVTAVNGSDFTLDNGKTVKTDANTRFAGFGISGLKTGDQVSVFGNTNSDGSIQAVKVTNQP